MVNRTVDIRVYEELCEWLPERIFDSHIHIGTKDQCGPISEERIKSDWAMEVGVEQSWEQWDEVCRALFPRQKVSALAMGVPFKEMYLEKNNDYVISGIKDPDSRALFCTRPEWDVSLIEEAFSKGFIGIKPYPDLAPDSVPDPGVFDYLPKSHLEVLNGRCGVLLLHLPRAGRLADPENIREICEIADNYPKIKFIVAHVGRSFCLPTAQKGLPHFVDYKNIYFDIAANLNADVFAYAFDTIGPERILYGSDLPITLMRGVREYEGEKYINFTDGDYSWNTNRKSPEEEANYTYFIYEEIRALIEAVRRVGLGRETIEKVMYSNCAELLGYQ